jgi:UDP-N-acetylmuramoyl-tripeptide--D-alanyl-D-alanine ligase
VLNVGTAHIGEFGSREAIAQAKGEIVESLSADGTAVLNADDPLVVAMSTRTRARVVTFGRDDADVRWRDVTLDELGRPSFELGHQGRWSSVRLLQAGAHQVPNAAAAAAMAVSAGVGWESVVEELGRARSLSPMRMALHEGADGVVVINDAYNANPASMAAALDALAAIGERGGRRTVAVLGEMLELGASSDHDHVAVGEHAARLGIDLVVTVGEAATAIARGARDTPGWVGLAVPTAGRDEAADWLRHNVLARDAVLVKASRGAALELLADALAEEHVPERPTEQPHHQEGGTPSR